MRRTSTSSPSYPGGLLGRSKFYVSLNIPRVVSIDIALVLPHHRHIPSLLHLTEAEKLSFANILSSVTKRYDNLFSCSFAYSMGIHQRPTPPEDGNINNANEEANIAHLHVHFFPPLLRSASVRKFLVGCVFCFIVSSLHRRSPVSNLWPKHNAISHPNKLPVD